MNFDCTHFRERLEAVLKRPRASENLSELGWHEHLLACTECRRMLQSEEALETLLDSLPRPKLPPELARRVLARLERTKNSPIEADPIDALDRLLDLADHERAPAGLSSRVLAKLAAERSDAQLDRLLERVPAPEVPVGLSARTLRALREQRMPRKVAFARSNWLSLAAAALIVLGAGAWLAVKYLRRANVATGDEIANSQPTKAADVAAPSPELLASMPVLESWDLLQNDDVDLLLSGVDTKDEMLLELSNDLGSDDSAAPSTPKKG